MLRSGIPHSRKRVQQDPELAVNIEQSPKP